MRPFALSLFTLSLACAGGSVEAPETTPNVSTSTSTGATPEGRSASKAGGATATTAAPATVGSDADAALTDHYLVILGSKLDPAERIPGVETLRGRPEIGAEVRQVLSSRFKNLMPCLAVTIAGASPDKKAAVALSKKLTAIGVDNYVKNAGAWVGPSSAIDAYCAAGDAPITDEVRVAARADGALWLPLPSSAAELSALAEKTTPPRALSDDYDAWIQPLGATEAKTYRVVDATTGRERTCQTTEDALLTLGTPHFGARQGEEGPSAPTCGSPARFHRLECGESTDGGHWVAVPEATPIGAYRPFGVGSAPLVDAARQVLTAKTDWEEEPAGHVEEEGPLEREVHVSRWRGPSGDVVLVVGTRTWGNGVCGGGDELWFGVFGVNGDTLGAALGELQQAEFANVEGLVDVGADGRPEVIVTSFPQISTIYGGNGNVAASLVIDYCDCAC